MSDPIRQQILLSELARDLGWQQGDAVPVTLRLMTPDRADLQVGFAVAAQLFARMPGTVAELGLVADVAPIAQLTGLIDGQGQLDQRCARALAEVGLVPVRHGPLTTGIEIWVGHSDGAPLWFDAVGWTALVNSTDPDQAERAGAPIGAILAACITASELFAGVHSSTRTSRRRVELSAWGAHVGPDLILAELDLGEVDMAGAGAVAQTMLWSLAASGARLRVFAADHDLVGSSSLERLPLCDRQAIGRAKIDCLKAGLGRTSIFIEGQAKRFEETHRPAIGTLISAVDDDHVRESLQQLAPPLLLSGTTGGLAATIEWSDLDPTRACLACNHPVQAGPTIKELAGRLGIPERDLRGSFTAEQLHALEQRFVLTPGTLEALAGRDVCGHLNAVAREALGIGGPGGSVGFLSWFAGVLMAVELIAHHCGLRDRPRFHLHALLRPERISQRNRLPRADCSCQSPFFRSFYARQRESLAATVRVAQQPSIA
jgi:molybdopterin/thiamine biosynthesis adenylyltransferase